MYDVPADDLVLRLAAELKGEDLPPPSWLPFVKSGSHASRPPHDGDWWYARCASILRRVYMEGPVGVNGLRKIYGGGKPSGYGAAHHRKAGGAIIRGAVHGLEKLGYLSRAEPGGRSISSAGMKKLDNLATVMLKEMAERDPRLKVYA
ncbi:MAG: 30S ribosomal protein S19e [Nitrosopumilus sp.]|nr:30S ribosomal protein S19e [Nitrosopumilus sp.]MDA7941675.1 30S ribosomal protein S19e [Nitrosopumilus sp.]MDA7943750.1 30S ribosomal protein S19e [Nitrosopumilus sp.]MDA7945114.1 30S ribosomal protein S19e [Nitrosopumilus sp.]MDA7953797.1 30S ribosomal protein S19e [Nitrosopumilus sp.]